MEQDRGDLWDSGKVASDETTQIAYSGKSLASRQECYWKIRDWDRDRKPSGWSKPALWQMGLLKPEDWSAKWIEAGLPSGTETGSLRGAKWIWCPEQGVDLTKSAPAGDRYFRCRVIVTGDEKPSRASILITVDDEYTLYINGHEIAHVNAPDGWKHPTRYDILPHLKTGENIIAIAGKNLASQAGVCAKVTMQAEGKTPQTIVSDHAWKTSANADTGWNEQHFDDAKWKNAFEVARFGQGVWKNVASAAATQPVPILRKSFRLADKPIASARLYMTALGVYQVRINGSRVGDQALHRIGPTTASGSAIKYTTWSRCSSRARMTSPRFWVTAGIPATSATAAFATSAPPRHPGGTGTELRRRHERANRER